MNKYLKRWLLVAAIAVAVFFAVAARSDVLTLVGATEVAKPKASLIASDLVLWCESGGPLNSAGEGVARDVCKAQQWTSFNQMGNRSWMFTTDGWYHLETIPTGPVVPPPYVFPGYTCFPKDASEVRIGNGRGFAVGLWYCDTPKKIQPHYFCGDPKNITVGKITFAKLIALAQAKRRCMADENTLIEEISDLKPTVINGTSPTAPAYKANANGTRNTREVKRVAVGTLCNWKMRLVDSTGKGTSFYAVVGEYDLYANCQLNGPISK